MVVLEQKLLYSCKVVVFGQSGFIRAKWFYSGKSGCLQTKWLHSRESCSIQAKVDVFGQKWLYSDKVVVFG